MNTDLAPPRQNLSGFVRWPKSDADGSIVTITFGSWLLWIPITIFVIFALLCLAAPFLAVMPGQPKLTLRAWLPLFGTWLWSLLFLYGARAVWFMAQPYHLNLDLASRRYELRKGYRRSEKIWTGTFEDINEIYIWKRWSRHCERHIYNVNISWKMQKQVTSLWTYTSKLADDPKPEIWARNFCSELGVPFGGILTGEFVKRWKRD
ncbi:MAG: hypothetical protein M3Y13_08520 [Armatimonadota bacterium]|nr:hypothetical protein [Armatimonadota bacterium]